MHPGKRRKAQSAIEFLSTYSFTFLIIALVLVIVFAFSSIPKKSLPFQCTAYGGFSCLDAAYTIIGSNSQLLVFLSDTQPGVVSISAFNAKIIGVANAVGSCSPSVTLPGSVTICTANFISLPTSGSTYTGTFNITANYCTNGVGNISNTACVAGSTHIYGGSISVQAQSSVSFAHYVPITLQNSQSSPTPVSFQQMITANSLKYNSYEANGLQNIEFTTGVAATGTVLQAWIESGASSTAVNTIYWIDMPPGAVPANGNTIIYMDFMTSNVMSSAGPTGEAPQISNTYAQYDNGANIFDNYQNFAGSSLWSGISSISGITLTQNNGLEIATTSTSTYYIMTNLRTTSPAIYDALVTAQNAGSSSNFQEGLVMDSSTPTSQNTGTSPGGTNYMFRLANGGGGYYQLVQGAAVLTGNNPLSPSYPYNSIESIQQSSTGLSFNDIGYTLSASTTALTSGYVGFYSYTTATGNTAFVQWLRTHAYPPGGVMPTASFGSVT